MIFKYKTQAMRRLTKLAGQGYVYHTSGTVSLEKAERLHQRFAEKYGTSLSDDQRYRAFKRGECKTQHIMYYCASDQVVRWWLVCTDGVGEIRDKESLGDARDKHHRLTFPAPKKYYAGNSAPPKYEMVRHHSRDQKTGNNKTRWTWQYHRDSYHNLLNSLTDAVAGVRYVDGKFVKDKRLVFMLDSLQRTPGFHESRRQATALHLHAKKVWRKRQSRPWPYREGAFKSWLGQYQTEIKLPAEYFQRREEKFRGIRKIDSPV